MRPSAALTLLALACAPLGACAAVQDALLTPQMTPMGYPSALMPQQTAVLQPAGLTAPDLALPREPRAASANTLWRSGARAFFQDQRAHRVGDILTVNVAITDSAQVQNTSVATRKANATLGVPNFLGLESSIGKILPKAFDPAQAVAVSSDVESNGQGSVNRSEAVTLTVAAIVTAVLPNGNLVIQGRQEVRINSELRELTVAGVVRPEDISAGNTIRHDQIAEARVSYGGRGQVSNVQKAPAGNALLTKFSPF